MKRRLGQILVAISLLLLLGVIVLWLRSLTTLDKWFLSTEHVGRGLITSEGQLMYARWERSTADPEDAPGMSHLTQKPIDLVACRPWREGGFHVAGVHVGTQIGISTNWFAFIVSFWTVAAALAILPAVKVCRWGLGIRQRIRSADRILANRCVNCGYDVSQSTGRCPECGTTIATANSI